MPDNNITPPPTSSGLSDFQLKLSYFYVTNKLFLRKLLVIFLIASDCLLWLYILFMLGVWLAGYQANEVAMHSLLYSASDAAATVTAASPKALSFSAPEAFSLDGEHYDILAEAANSNSNWLAEFDYEFVGAGSTSTVYHGFALPGGTKTLLDLNRDTNNVSLQVTNLSWRRIDGYAALQTERDRFVISDDAYTPAAAVGEPSRIKFTIANDSPYGYWDAGVVVTLYNAGTLVAVNYFSIAQFQSETQRAIELNWSKALPSVDSWKIAPEVNYLDENNLMPPPAY